MEPVNSSNSQESYVPIIDINVSSIFSPFKAVAYLDVNIETMCTFMTYRECIQGQMEKNLPYLIALVQDEGSLKTYCFDAIEICEWNKRSPTNPLTNNKIQNIFIFAMLEYSDAEDGEFHYLGTSEEVNLESPNVEHIVDYDYIGFAKGGELKIDTSALFAPLETESYFSINSQESDTKTCFLKLINAQKNKHLPYILAIVKGEKVNSKSNIQCLDALTLYKNNDQRLDEAFLYILDSTENYESGEFEYLGTFNQGKDLHDFIQTLLNPASSNADALFKVYENYKDGKHVEINLQEGINWLKRASEKGHTVAQYELGLYYADGIELKQNYQEATRLWKLSANKGNPHAQCALGESYLNGFGVKQDFKLGVQYLTLASKSENPRAMCMLGYCYARGGDGLKVDFEKAVELWTCVSKKDYRLGRLLLAASLLEGKGINKNSEDGIMILEELVKTGDKNAMYALDIFNYRDQTITFAQIVEFLIISEHSLPIALYTLGNVYEDLLDFATAYKWWERSTNYGYVPSMLKLAECFYKGRGFMQDYRRAVQWWITADQHEDGEAAYCLSICCLRGDGVEPNEIQSVVYLERSAARGYSVAQYELGMCYLLGNHVPKNLDLAKKWIKSAADQGYEIAKKELKKKELA